MEVTRREGVEEWSELWYELPNNFKENVLAWLPAEILCRYRSVCKEWNALLSSTEFIYSDWVAAPPNNKPCLVFFQDFHPFNCMLYCFFTYTWKRLSFAFLEGQYDTNRLQVHGSAVFNM